MPLVEDKTAPYIANWLAKLPADVNRLVIKEGNYADETIPMYSVEMLGAPDRETLAAELSEACQACADNNRNETKFYIEAHKVTAKGAATALRRLPLRLAPSMAEAEEKEQQNLGVMQVLERTNSQLMDHNDRLVKHQTDHVGKVLEHYSDALEKAAARQQEQALALERAHQEAEKYKSEAHTFYRQLEDTQNEKPDDPDSRRKEMIIDGLMGYFAKMMNSTDEKRSAAEAAAAAANSASAGTNGASHPDESASDDSGDEMGSE